MKLKRKIAFGSLLLIALVVAFLVVRLRGASAALEKYRKQLVAQGEKLEISEVAPHPSADEQDSARRLLDAIKALGKGASNTPPSIKVLSPGHAMVNWREQVLPTYDYTNIWPAWQEQISRNENELSAVRAGLHKPAGQFGLDYSQGFYVDFTHLAPLKKTAQWLVVAAELELRQNQPDEACEDVKATLAVSDFLDREPLVISQLVRVAILQIALGGTWEVMHHPDVYDEELRTLQRSWESIEVMKSATASLEMERNCQRIMFDMARQSNSPFGLFPGPVAGGTFSEILDQARSDPKAGYEAFMERYPRFWAWKMKWSYHEELYDLQLAQATLDAARKMKKGGAFVPIIHEFDVNTTNVLEMHASDNSQFKLEIGPDLFRIELRKIYLMETECKILVAAIALERFHLAHKKYPDALAELTPTYLAALPLDPMDGKPLRYHPRLDGTFLLYSVGEDGVDNGGDATQTTNSVSQTLYWQYGRDIVWPTPATPDEIKAYKEKMLASQKPKRVNR